MKDVINNHSLKQNPTDCSNDNQVLEEQFQGNQSWSYTMKSNHTITIIDVVNETIVPLILKRVTSTCISRQFYRRGVHFPQTAPHLLQKALSHFILSQVKGPWVFLFSVSSAQPPIINGHPLNLLKGGPKARSNSTSVRVALVFPALIVYWWFSRSEQLLVHGTYLKNDCFGIPISTFDANGRTDNGEFNSSPSSFREAGNKHDQM